MFILPLSWLEAVGVSATEIQPYNMVDFRCGLVSEDIGNRFMAILADLQTRPYFIHDVGVHGIVSHVQSLPSSITGVTFILSYFSPNEYIENLITEGQRRGVPAYATTVDRRTNARYVEVSFLEHIRREWHETMPQDTRDPITMAATDGDTAPVPAPSTEAWTRLDEVNAEFSDPLAKRGSSNGTVNLGNGHVCVRPAFLAADRLKDVLIPEITALSSVVDKDIVIVTDAIMQRNVNKTLEAMGTNKSHKFLVVVFNPDEAEYLTSFEDNVNEASGDIVSCLGHRCTNVYVPVVSEDSRKKSMSLSDFSKIWFDTATNIIFAMRKNDIVYVTVGYGTDYSCYGNVLKILGDRWQRPITPEDRKTDRQFLKQLQIDDKNKFVGFAVENANVYYNSILEKYKEAVDEVARLQPLLLEAMKMQRQLAVTVDRFNVEEYNAKIRTEMSDQFDAISAMDKVKSILIEDGIVSITTNTITAEDPRTHKFHDLGKFLIRINALLPQYHSTGCLVIKNLVHAIEHGGQTMSAPHIYRDGHICHGNLLQMVSHHYANRDILGMVQDVFAFLEHPNVEDGVGRIIDRYPVAEDFKPSYEEQVPDPSDDELIKKLNN